MFTAALHVLVTQALQEDLAGGDLTSEATVSPSTWGHAIARAKAPLVLSGGDVYSHCFFAVDAGCRTEQLVPDGTFAQPGTELFYTDGPARALLMAERTALNFIQRLSGTATLTRSFVEAAGGRTRIADTRKTTPGLRALERRAVRDGGGHNHRDSLGAAVLIKENHVAAAGGIAEAVGRARAHAPHTCRIEVEVEDFDQLEAALAAGAEVIMLDDFADDDIGRAVQQIAGRATLEVSGSMTLERVRRLSGLGVDVISVGALTHSAPAADISLLLERVGDVP